MNHTKSQGLFVTGTDTDVGKTVFATALISALRTQGLDAVGMKPVSAGCTKMNGELRNEDAERLMRVSGTDDYALTNPIAYEPAIAPHIAATISGVPIDLDKISRAYARLSAAHALVVIEGAGGWRVPLDDQHDMSAIALRLQTPVVLVVGLTLGCLNHALLSAEAIEAAGCELAGWAGSCIDTKFTHADENIETLNMRIKAPCLGILPYIPDGKPDEMACYIDTTVLCSSYGATGV
jgi:dethiobiotin synthetase